MMSLVQPNVEDRKVVKQSDEEEGRDEIESSGHGDIETIENKSCCKRLRYEIWQGKIFDINEPNGQVIDIQQSFSPLFFAHSTFPRLPIVVVRIGFLAAAITALVLASIDSREYWFIYATNLAFIFGLAYLVFSIIISIYKKCLHQPDSPDERPHPLVILTWALYAIATPLELAVTILYWALVYDGNKINYHRLFNHGIFFLLLLIDGYLLARIPLRIKQIILLQVITAIYFIWTLIHSYTNIGSFGGKDLIYDVIDWRNKIGTTIMYVSVIFIVLNPILFIILWTLSLWSKGCSLDGGRRYLYSASLS